MKGLYKVASVEETWQCARDFAQTLKPGDVVALEGDLGAGKTTWTQGLASALGVSGRVTSPTFAIVREHKRLNAKPGEISMLVHMDLYRLNSDEDLEAIGWDDYLAKGAVVVVEWPERAPNLTAAARRVSFHYGDSEEERIIRFDG